MELEPVIGLEIHIQLKTKSKMFCSCANIFGDVPPNSAICPICLGYPGTLPVPNKTAIAWTQLLGSALDCKLAAQSKFDRKSYFYPDLPKGYQISQYDQPFCGVGQIAINVDGHKEIVGIERIHLEEDAAKNTHPVRDRISNGTHPIKADYTLIDYNRAGTPLAEIVTKPDIKSPVTAKTFLQELQRIARVLEVSDADMEKGQMRCDANISLREVGSDQLHPKTEIKNLNSFRFVAKALQYEIERQTKLWQSDGAPQIQSTRGFNAKTGKTTQQRTKEGAADYRYFPEPDIPPFTFTKQELARTIKSIPELPHEKNSRLQRQYGISPQQATILIDYPTLANFLENTASEIKQLDNDQIDLSPSDRGPIIKDATNIILRDLRQMVDTSDLTHDQINITPANFAEMVTLIYQGKMSKNNTPQVLEEMQRTGGDPDHILDNLNLEQVSDTSDLTTVVQQVLKDNPDVIAKIKSGKGSAIQFLIGQVMKATQGKANPSEVTKIIKKLTK